MENIKNVFFFGAGAEICYGIPSGSEYILDSMITKKEKLYDELKKIYKKTNYQKNFIFSSDSKVFASIIYNSYLEYKKENKNCQIDIFNEIDISADYKENIEKIKNILNKKPNIYSNDYSIYELIILKENRNLLRDLTKLFDYLKYYGAIERNFATLLNYKTYNVQSSKLINYFWSCYFSILIPYIQSYYKDNKDISYEVLLKSEDNNYPFINIIENLKNADISEFYFYDKENKCYKKETSYYQEISELFNKNSVAITTNYTFFVEKAFDQSIYLSGKLDEFENIDTFIVSNNFDSNSIPFLYTQAPIKPIIGLKIIKQIYNAIEYMEKTTNIFIIGYSFCEEDSHIKTIFRELQFKESKNVVYCNYENKNIDGINDFLMDINAKIEPYNSCEDLINIIKKYQ